MSETEDKDNNKPLSLSRPGTLQLNKTIETGQVRQNFSHGRSKMVQVEVRKKRTYAQNETGRMSEVKEELEVFQGPKEEIVAPVEKGEAAPQPAQPGSQLTIEEKASRARALQDAKVADEKVEEELNNATSPSPGPKGGKDDEVKAEQERKNNEEAERIEKELAAADTSAAVQKLENAASGETDVAKPRTKPVATREEEQNVQH